jgi:hypothetical protein
MTQAEPEPQDPLEAGLQLAAALERQGVPYALGGALAYGLWAVPRATLDVDVNVFVNDDGLDTVYAALESLGIVVSREQCAQAARSRGMFAVQWGRYRLDIFTASIDYSWKAAQSRVRHAIEGHSAWFLSAEAIAVFKLLFFRPKDLVDLERLISVQGERLDIHHVRAEIVAMLGEDDERVQKWDELTRR